MHSSLNNPSIAIITNHHQNQNLILHLDKNITHKIIILHLNHIIHKTHQQQGEVVTIHVMVKGRRREDMQQW